MDEGFNGSSHSTPGLDYGEYSPVPRDATVQDMIDRMRSVEYSKQFPEHSAGAQKEMTVDFF